MPALIAVALVILSLQALAANDCPSIAPKGYTIEKSGGQNVLVNDKRTITLAFKCLTELSPKEAEATIDLFPNVKPIKEKMSYQDLSSGTGTIARLYFDTRQGMIQAALVAKFSSTKEKEAIEAEVLSILDSVQTKKK